MPRDFDAALPPETGYPVPLLTWDEAAHIVAILEEVVFFTSARDTHSEALFAVAMSREAMRDPKQDPELAVHARRVLRAAGLLDIDNPERTTDG